MKSNQLTDNIKGNFYILGDSLSDIGVLVGSGNAILKYLAIPNTIVMKPPFYQNCFTNGKVAVAVMADYFSIALTPAWKFNFLGMNSEQIGNNYAVSGAVINSNNDATTIQSWVMKCFDFNHQITALTSQHQLLKNDIIFVIIGTNDILSAIKKTSAVEQHQLITTALTLLKVGLETLIRNGAQTIIIANIPDISKIPLFKNNEKIQASILLLINKFNQGLASIISILNSNKQNIFHYDLFKGIIHAMNEFKKLDCNHNISDGALTTNFSQIMINGEINVHFNPNVTAENMDQYFFFDDIHPNQWAHNFLAQSLITMIKNIKVS